MAISKARSGKGPSIIECMTYRWHGHHAGEPRDGLLYRTAEEMEEWRKKDPVKKLKEELIKNGFMTDNEFTSLENNFKKELEEAIDFAEKSPFPEPEELYKDVYV
jgi:pyruvate dehydrogenase E1 component alpha subunit